MKIFAFFLLSQLVLTGGVAAASSRVVVLLDHPAVMRPGALTVAQHAIDEVIEQCAGREIAVVTLDRRVTSLIVRQDFTRDARAVRRAVEESFDLPVQRVSDPPHTLEREFVHGITPAVHHVLENVRQLSGDTDLVVFAREIPVRGRFFRGVFDTEGPGDHEYKQVREAASRSGVQITTFQAVPILDVDALRDLARISGGEFVPLGKSPRNLCASAPGSAAP